MIEVTTYSKNILPLEIKDPLTKSVKRSVNKNYVLSVEFYANMGKCI